MSCAPRIAPSGSRGAAGERSNVVCGQLVSDITASSAVVLRCGLRLVAEMIAGVRAERRSVSGSAATIEQTRRQSNHARTPNGWRTGSSAPLRGISRRVALRIGRLHCLACGVPCLAACCGVVAARPCQHRRCPLFVLGKAARAQPWPGTRSLQLDFRARAGERTSSSSTLTLRATLQDASCSRALWRWDDRPVDFTEA